MIWMKNLIQKIKDSDIGVWLSVAAVVGYGIYYIYGTSFNQYYGLPKNFLELKMENLAFVIVLVVFAIGFLFVIPEYSRLIFETFPFLSVRKKKIKTFFENLSLIFFLIPLGMYLFGLLKPIELIPFLILIVVVVKFDIPSPKLAIGLCILIVGGWIIMYGSNSAAEKEDYLIMESTNDQNFVVINTYKDKFIIAPVNLEKKEITPKFQFIEIKSDIDDKVEFSLVHTGKLKVKKVTGENDK